MIDVGYIGWVTTKDGEIRYVAEWGGDCEDIAATLPVRMGITERTGEYMKYFDAADLTVYPPE